jgi:hypothetical protein
MSKSNFGKPDEWQVLEVLNKLKTDGFRSIDEALAHYQVLEKKGTQPKPAAEDAKIESVTEPQAEKSAPSLPIKEVLGEAGVSKPSPEGFGQLEPKAPSSSLKQPVSGSRASDSSQAGILLYVGAALVVVSVLVFVGFNWQTFSPFVQSFILLLLNLAFYVVGFFTLGSAKLKQASHTFLIIASIMAGLTGIGLWNFWLQEVLWLPFEVYWLIYSIILLMLYAFTFRSVGLRSLRYLTLAAIYSGLISLSLVLTTDGRFQVIILSLLNLLLYVLHSKLGQLSASVGALARVVNQILQVLILLIVLFNLLDIAGTNLVWIALAALAVPLLFDLSVIYKKRLVQIGEGYILPALLPLVLLLVGAVFEWGALGQILAQVVYLAGLSWVRLVVFGKAKFGQYLNYLSLTLGLISFASVLSALGWLTLVEQLILSVTIALILLVSSIWQKGWIQAGNVALGLPVVFLWWLGQTEHPPEPPVVLNIWLVAALTSLAGFTYQRLNQRASQWAFFPSICLLGFLTLVFALAGGGFWAFVALALLGLALSIISRMLPEKWLDLAGVSLILGGVGYLTSFLLNQEILTDTLAASFIFLGVLAVYAVVYDRERQNLFLRSSNLLALGVSGVAASSLVAVQSGSLFVVLSLLLAYASFAVWRYRSILSGAAAVLLYVFWLTVGLIHLEVDFSLYLLLYAVSALGLAYGANQKLEKFKQVLKVSYFAALVLVVFVLLFSLVQLVYPITLEGMMALIFSFTAIFLLGEKNRLFYYFCGIPWVILAWHLGRTVEITNQIFYTTFISLYLLAIAAFWQRLKQTASAGRALEVSAYSFQLFMLLLASLPQRTWEHTFYGVITVALSAAIIFVGTWRRFNAPVYTGLGFMTLALIVLFYRTVVWIINLIPWYIHIFFIGLILILGAVYLLSRNQEKSGQPKLGDGEAGRGE